MEQELNYLSELAETTDLEIEDEFNPERKEAREKELDLLNNIINYITLKELETNK